MSQIMPVWVCVEPVDTCAGFSLGGVLEAMVKCRPDYSNSSGRDYYIYVGDWLELVGCDCKGRKDMGKTWYIFEHTGLQTYFIIDFASFVEGGSVRRIASVREIGTEEVERYRRIVADETKKHPGIEGLYWRHEE